MRRRWIATLVILIVAGGVVAAVVVVKPFRSAEASSNGATTTAATKLASIARRSLTSQLQVSGTLGFQGTYSVINQAHGTITTLPDLGQEIQQGQVIYRVDGAPVILLYGAIPAYRDLAEAPTSTATMGTDVQQLNAALVALGYATKSQLSPTSMKFTAETKTAVKKLQKALSVTQSGALTLGQVIFLPTAIRITATTAILGGTVQPGAVVTATATTRVVNVSMEAALQSQVKNGDVVVVTLPNNQTTAGVVSSVGKVATAAESDNPGSRNSPTIAVTVTLNDPAAAGTLDQAPVLVSIVTAHVENVLVVPVNSLLSLSGGGYAVEVSNGGVQHLEPVTTGLFDDSEGLVEISGSGLSAGQQIVVPAS
jgi:hypothetical protein